MGDIVIVDNYDSFTYNLVQLVGELTGAWPLVISNDIPEADVPFETASHFILSPGPGHPGRPDDFGVCAAVFRRATVPVLGVCLGHQGLALACGGRVVPSPRVVHGYRSTIDHDGRGIFSDIDSPLEVVRYHSWMVDEPVPDELEVVARSRDGVVMALAHRSLPLWGVQFHPESVLSEAGAQLLRNFISLGEAPRKRATTSRSIPSAARPSRLAVKRLPLEVDGAAVYADVFRDRGPSFWLDSATTAPSSARSAAPRFSYIGAATEEVVVAPRVEAEFFESLERATSAMPTNASDFDFDFCGGYVGYLGYEAAAAFDLPTAGASPWPQGALIPCDRFVVIDHRERATYVVAVDDGSSDAHSWLEAAAKQVAEARAVPISTLSARLGAPRPRRSWEQYRRDILECLDAIEAGESYELCLTNLIQVEGDVEPEAFYRRLRAQNPAPYGALVSLPDLWIASSSPELFLELDRAGNVLSKPMKGTSRRVLGDPQADEQARAALATSAKDRAENLMVTDLVRNDLGRVCELGSVHCRPLMDVESYASLHQLVTSVHGVLRADRTIVDLLRATFPGGSMTGAPKHRSMEILAHLEQGARGVYSGALGYVSRSGAAALSMCIRMAVGADGVIAVGCGGAIVADSDPDAEIAEAKAKAAGVLRSLRAD